jgi:COP9 signalosome complex subunit 4
MASASDEVTSALLSIDERPTSTKSQAYQELLTQIIGSKGSDDDTTSANLIDYFDSLFTSSLGIIAVRPLVAALIDRLASAPAEVKVKVGSHITESLQSQLASYEEQDAKAREILADGHEADEEWALAAKALQGIHLDTTQRQVSDRAKVEIWIRIVRCYLEEDDTVAAETALNKIKNSVAAVQVMKENPGLRLHYQLSQARILDSRRDFLNASAEYLGVSFNTMIDEGERKQALSAAIKTAILAPAGPARSRTLAKLYKDERSAETHEYGILENMFLDRLLSPIEVDAFASTLAPHQLATTADGSTVLSKAVIEHNLLAASRLYANISTASLAQILGLKDGKDDMAAEKAEDYAARMVEQGRLRGEIDQIAGVINFETVPGAELRGSLHDLREWDQGVQGLVEHVERCAAGVLESFPVSDLTCGMPSLKGGHHANMCT